MIRKLEKSQMTSKFSELSEELQKIIIGCADISTSWLISLIFRDVGLVERCKLPISKKELTNYWAAPQDFRIGIKKMKMI